MPKDVETEESKKLAQRKAFEESQRRGQLKTFERLAQPFFRFCDGGLDALLGMQNLMTDSDKTMFEKLVRDVRESSANLNTFLRSVRLRMQKGK